MTDKKNSTRPAIWNCKTFAKEFPSESSCLYLIESDSFAQHALWKEWSSAAEKLAGPGSNPGKTRIEWSGRGASGHMITIGHIESRPIVVSFMVDEIAGVPVAFYYGCSQLVDHKMIADFLESAMPHVSKTDAGNFHNFVHNIDDLSALALRRHEQKELELVAQRGAAASRRAL